MRRRRMSGSLWLTDSKCGVAHFRVNIVINEELQVSLTGILLENHIQDPHKTKQ